MSYDVRDRESRRAHACRQYSREVRRMVRRVLAPLADSPGAESALSCASAIAPAFNAKSAYRPTRNAPVSSHPDQQPLRPVAQ
jgi:hypothetical protein